MKQIAALLFILMVKVNAQDYFPLRVGNNWTYCGNSDTVHKRTYYIRETPDIGGKKYCVFEQSNLGNDTIREDSNGNIWRLSKGVDTLWFDFSKDSGAIYTIPSRISYIYTVKVVKNVTEKTYNGTYANCIRLEFDILQVTDAQIFYTFAPGVGLVKQVGAKKDDLLYSAVINGHPLLIEQPHGILPSAFALMQNYPNPFNPRTTIDYELRTTGFVTLYVFDMLGRVIKTLVNKRQDAGKYSIDFDGRDLTSGIYFYSLMAGNYSSVKKLVLLK